MKRSVHLALGSNLGDRVYNINRAVNLLGEHVGKLEKTSHLYETPPWGITHQPLFLNAACRIKTDLNPIKLLERCKHVETLMGRPQPGSKEFIRWGPRVIDIDIAFCSKEIVNVPTLQVPHIGVSDRECVLRPLCDMDPDFQHPASGKSMSLLLQENGKHEAYKVLPVGRGRVLPLGKRTYVMGILNVTPDSFSDGGLFSDKVERSVAHALAMEREGADMIDVGGETTRPGADRVPEAEELRRIIPVIKELRARLLERTVISVDTTRASVAEAAIDAGADVVNDISGGTFDLEMIPTVKRIGAPVILMHTRGTPKTMTSLTTYSDLVADIVSFLKESISRSLEAGIPMWMCVVDPGIGFAKNFEQNFTLLREMHQISAAVNGLPLLVGTSRKGFIGHATGQKDARQRVHGTGATCAAAIAGGADIIRVHDVGAMVDVAKVSDKIWRSPVSRR